MKFTVLREFNFERAQVQRGDQIDLAMTPRVQRMIEQRYLLPAEPEAAPAPPSKSTKTASTPKG